jgi:hypothetical protein
MTEEMEQDTVLTTSAKINKVFLGLKVVKRTPRKVSVATFWLSPKRHFEV